MLIFSTLCVIVWLIVYPHHSELFASTLHFMNTKFFNTLCYCMANCLPAPFRTFGFSIRVFVQAVKRSAHFLQSRNHPEVELTPFSPRWQRFSLQKDRRRKKQQDGIKSTVDADAIVDTLLIALHSSCCLVGVGYVCWFLSTSDKTSLNWSEDIILSSHQRWKFPSNIWYQLIGW